MKAALVRGNERAVSASSFAADATCDATAKDKKLAGAALKSFMTNARKTPRRSAKWMLRRRTSRRCGKELYHEMREGRFRRLIYRGPRRASRVPS